MTVRARKGHRQGARRDPTISLINIVFLILIFFMVSSTLSRPAGVDIEMVAVQGLDCCAGSDTLQIAVDGGLFVAGAPIAGAQAYLDGLPEGAPARIAPDRRLPARDLLMQVGELRGLGAERILIVVDNAP